MLHNVLVCLDASQGREALTDCEAVAYEFAAMYRARLVGLHVRPLLLPMAPLMYPPEVALGATMAMASMEASARAAADDAQDAGHGEEYVREFLEGARRAGIEATCQSVRGDVVEEIVKFAHAADLVLLPDAHRPGMPAWPVARLVKAVARPILLASQAALPIRRIAVAYDGSAGADHALQAAVDIAVNWPRPRPDVILLGVAHGAESQSGMLASAEQYVRGYGLEYHTHLCHGKPGEAIVSAADDEAANLLCVGAYNHSMLREALLGSTTDEIVEHRHQPLLLCN